MFETAIFSILFFSVFTILVYTAMWRSLRVKKTIEKPDKLGISIVIAAKNEQANLENLFSALENQNYPKEKFEIIFVDDNSTDDTFTEAEKYASRFLNFHLLKAENKILPAKKGALDLGISQARFPFLLFTDADCAPQNNWLNAFSEKFSAGYELLFGFAPFHLKKTFANRFFCFENLRTTLLTSSAAWFNLPYSAASRSLGIRKEIFNQLGGFSKTLQTLGGDDDLLIREAVNNNCKIGIIAADASLVFSNPQKSFADYFLQKRRHTATSFHYLWQHKLFLAIWHLTNILAVDSLFILPFFPEAGFIFLTKIFCDYLIVYSFQRKFSYKFSFGEIFFFQILYECFIVVNFLNAKFFKVKWK
ncbi:MAG: glycosyltransferase [Ignavibacteria bacterium]|nr:glycosyltransferase [Ignavibacteria bacterium]